MISLAVFLCLVAEVTFKGKSSTVLGLFGQYVSLGTWKKPTKVKLFKWKQQLNWKSKIRTAIQLTAFTILLCEWQRIFELNGAMAKVLDP